MVNTSLNLLCIFVTFHCTIEEGAILEGDDMFHLRKADVTARIPPHVFFFVSAIFHYLGPAFAVLLFSSVSVLGVAWFRIASAAVVFAVWRRPWRLFAAGDLPHSLRNGWSYRVPWPYHTRCTRRTDPTEHWRTTSGSRRRMALDGCPLRRTGAGVCVRFCQLCLLHALRGTRPSDRPGWRRSRHRSAGSSDVRRFPDHYPHWDQRGLARDQQATAAPRGHRCRYLLVGHPVCK